MSLIATFWTLEAARRGELVDAFKPYQRKCSERHMVFFSKTHTEKVYPWHSYMTGNAREEARWPHSGVAFVDLELMVPDGAKPFALGLPESGELCTHSQASVALLDARAAQIIRTTFSASPLTQTAVVRFYESDGRPLADLGDADYILSAQRQLIAWSEKVTPDRIGLLMVG